MDVHSRRLWRLGYALVALTVMLLIASCGQSTRISAGKASTGTVSATNTSNTPTTVSHAGATMTPENSPASATAGVTLSLNQRQYHTDSLIIVTIHNGSQKPIWAADHQTSCTVLALERLSQNSWYRVGQCSSAVPTRLIPIQPGQNLVQRLSSQQEMDTGAGWLTGTYRVTLTYRIGTSESSLTSGSTIHSTEFAIS